MGDRVPHRSSPRPSGTGGRWRTLRTRIDAVLPRVPSRFEDRLTSPLPGILVFLFLLGVAVASILLTRPPAALPETAPVDRFSAARALSHIQTLAREPHPLGTEAHAQAQAYLIAQLRQLGLEPQVQKTLGINIGAVAPVENVLARLPGSGGGGKAILLNAHYDSVRSGLGASDDASGVATLLETARALKAASRTLKNDVILLFDDGEELGCPGQRAFVEEHPWATDVGLMLQFDAAVLSGPVYTYLTPKGRLLSEYAQAAPYPLASSFVIDISPDPEAGKWDPFFGVDYGFLSFCTQPTAATYHTMLDDAGRVDLDSLQHYGSYAVSLVSHFGDLDLSTMMQGGDAVFFNVLGTNLLIHYPYVWIAPFVVLAALVWIGALVFGLRWKQLSLRGLILGALASAFVAVLLAVIGYLLWRLVLVAYPQYGPNPFVGDASMYHPLYYWLAFVALATGLGALLHSGLRARIRTEELAAGSLFLWLVGAVVASVLYRGASYAFTWPLLFAGVGLWGWFLLRRYDRPMIWSIVWLALCAVPALLLTGPVMFPGGSWAVSVQTLWIPMLVVGLLVGMLAPHMAIIARPYRSLFPVFMGMIVVGFLVAGHVTSDPSETRPLRDDIFYRLSADEGKAYWETYELDSWTAALVGADSPEGVYRDIYPWEDWPPSHRAAAPVADLPAPEAKQLPTQGAEDFRVHVVPTPGAFEVDVYTVPDSAPDVTYYLDGKVIRSEGVLMYTTPPAEGFDLAVEVPGQDELTLRVINRHYGLPALQNFTHTPRPAWIVPTLPDFTEIAKTFTFARE